MKAYRLEIGFARAVLCTVAGLSWLAVVSAHEAPVPCSEYGNVDRAYVPARCFSDFLGKDGGQ